MHSDLNLSQRTNAPIKIMGIVIQNRLLSALTLSFSHYLKYSSSYTYYILLQYIYNYSLFYRYYFPLGPNIFVQNQKFLYFSFCTIPRHQTIDQNNNNNNKEYNRTTQQKIFFFLGNIHTCLVFFCICINLLDLLFMLGIMQFIHYFIIILLFLICIIVLQFITM